MPGAGGDEQQLGVGAFVLGNGEPEAAGGEPAVLRAEGGEGGGPAVLFGEAAAGGGVGAEGAQPGGPFGVDDVLPGPVEEFGERGVRGEAGEVEPARVGVRVRHGEAQFAGPVGGVAFGEPVGEVRGGGEVPVERGLVGGEPGAAPGFGADLGEDAEGGDGLDQG